MGSSASAPVNNDGTITIASSLVEEHLQKFSELESKLNEAENLNNTLTSKNNISQNLLFEERDNSSLLHARAEQLVTETSRLESEVGALKPENSTNIIKNIELYFKVANLSNDNEQLRAANDTLQTSKTATTSEMFQLKSQISGLQKTIEELTKQIEEIKQRLTEETNKADQSIRMLNNERKQNKDSKQALKTKYTMVKVQNDQLERELTQLKKTKLFSIQATLNDLTKRTDTISNQILGSAKNNNRENFMTKFQTFKDGNDRLIKHLKSVIFTTRLYQNHHDALLKLQDETDETCMGTLKTINELSKDCKKLIDDYNTSFPDSFLKVVADHTRACDALEKVNFSSLFAKEEAIQEEVLRGLSNEKNILEGILNGEKNNNHTNQVANEKPQVANEKPNNVNYINNLNSKQTYDLVIYNMVEANDHYSDIVSFETFMQDVTGRSIKCLGVQRFGVPSKTPRIAKVTLDSSRDYEDVLNSKLVHPVHFQRYGRVRVAKFDPNKKKAKKNFND